MASKSMGKTMRARTLFGGVMGEGQDEERVGDEDGLSGGLTRDLVAKREERGALLSENERTGGLARGDPHKGYSKHEDAGARVRPKYVAGEDCDGHAEEAADPGTARRGA